MKCYFLRLESNIKCVVEFQLGWRTKWHEWSLLFFMDVKVTTQQFIENCCFFHEMHPNISITGNILVLEFKEFVQIFTLHFAGHQFISASSLQFRSKITIETTPQLFRQLHTRWSYSKTPEYINRLSTK